MAAKSLPLLSLLQHCPRAPRKGGERGRGERGGGGGGGGGLVVQQHRRLIGMGAARRHAYSLSAEKDMSLGERPPFDEEDDEGESARRTAHPGQKPPRALTEDADQEPEDKGGGRYYILDDFSDWDPEDDEDSGGPRNKLPAEMRYFDTAKIYIKGGDGGDGAVAFRREKFVERGGPSGGNGGDGGDVFFQADAGITSLSVFRQRVHFRATAGKRGGGSGMHGECGRDVVIRVPVGTIIRKAAPSHVDQESGEYDSEHARLDGGLMEHRAEDVAELLVPDEKVLVMKGGRGGRGNAAFKTGKNNAPRLAEKGEPGPEMWLDIELKLVADVGIVGVPNAGKSTLLSVVSSAKPKIDNYPFTTIVPNLGVCELEDFRSMVLADVPGIIEGAHTGRGLGREFLRHCQRAKVLIHLIAGDSFSPIDDFDAINQELEMFSPELAVKPQVVAFTKMDDESAMARWTEEVIPALRQRGVEATPISAVSGVGVKELMERTWNLLAQQPQDNSVKVNWSRQVSDPRKDDMRDYRITVKKASRQWAVYGSAIERFTKMTNFEQPDSMRRFHRTLDAAGISKKLSKAGIKDGDSIRIGEVEFEWSSQYIDIFQENSKLRRTKRRQSAQDLTAE